MSAATHPLTLIDPVCGKPAYHMDRVPLPADLLDARRIEHLDDRPADPMEPWNCDSCGRHIPFGDRRFLFDPSSYVTRSTDL